MTEQKNKEKQFIISKYLSVYSMAHCWSFLFMTIKLVDESFAGVSTTLELPIYVSGNHMYFTSFAFIIMDSAKSSSLYSTEDAAYSCSLMQSRWKEQTFFGTTQWCFKKKSKRKSWKFLEDD